MVYLVRPDGYVVLADLEASPATLERYLDSRCCPGASAGDRGPQGLLAARCIVGSADRHPAQNVTVDNTAPSDGTLGTMLVISLMGVPLLLLGTGPPTRSSA